MNFEILARLFVGLLILAPGCALVDSLVRGGPGQRLLGASEAGDVAAVGGLLAEGADVNVRGPNGVTPILYAAQNGHTEIARILLAAGADPNAAIEGFGLTPLIQASMNGHAEIVDMLIAAGVDVDARRKGGGTALMMAARNGHVAIVRALIAARADLTILDDSGNTAEHVAMSGGQPAIVKMLRDARRH